MEDERRHGRKICTVDGCDRYHEARGYCRMHYTRYTRGIRGDALEVPGPKKRGPSKLTRDHVILIRLTPATTLREWAEHLASDGLSISPRALADVRNGRSYREVPMDTGALEEEARERGLGVTQ